MRSTTRDSRDTRASSNHAGRDLSSVSIKRIPELTVLDKDLARDYTMESDIPAFICEANAKVARIHQRPDHERVWKTLSELLCPTVPLIEDDGVSTIASVTAPDTLNEKGPYELAGRDRGHVKWGDHPLAKATVKAL